MGRKRLGQQSTRKLQKSKGSYYVSVPIELIRELKWKGGQKLVVKKRGKDKIVIEDWKK